MRRSRIGMTLGTILASALAAGCASGPSRLLLGPAPSVIATPEPPRTGPSLLGWLRQSTAPEAPKTTVQPAAAVVARTPERLPSQAWTSSSLASGIKNTRLGDWFGQRFSATHAAQAAQAKAPPPPAITPAQMARTAERRVSAHTPAPTRASRSGPPVSTLPVQLQVRAAPLTDDEDRRTSYEETAATTSPRVEVPDEAALEAPPALVETTPEDVPAADVAPEADTAIEAESTIFPDPVEPADLANLDRILEETHDGEDLPPAPVEVPAGMPDEAPRTHDRPHVRRVAVDPRPVGLPAGLPQATYPEDHSHAGTAVETEAGPVPSEQSVAVPAPAPQRFSLFPRTRQRLAALFGRESRDVPQRR